MFLIRGVFNSLAGVLHSFAQTANNTADALSHTFPPNHTSRVTKQTPLSVRVEMGEIVNQMIDQLRQTYETRASILNTVCIIYIFKPASWIKLYQVIFEIDQSIITQCKAWTKLNTVESRANTQLLISIQQSFAVIIPKLDRLIELGTALSQRVEQENLSDEEAKETEEYKRIAVAQDPNGFYSRGPLLDEVQDDITTWLKNHGKVSYYQPLLDFWDEHGNNFLKFTKFPTISLVDPDPKPFVITHERKILTSDQLRFPDEIYSKFSQEAGSDLIEKLNYLSVFIIGPQHGVIDLISTVFPNHPPRWYESMLSWAAQPLSSSTSKPLSSSTSKSSSKSSTAQFSLHSTRFPRSPTGMMTSTPDKPRSIRGGSMTSPQSRSGQKENSSYSYVREKRINTANQQKMTNVVQGIVKMFNREHIPLIPPSYTASSYTMSPHYLGPIISPRAQTASSISASSSALSSTSASSISPSRHQTPSPPTPSTQLSTQRTRRAPSTPKAPAQDVIPTSNQD